MIENRQCFKSKDENNNSKKGFRSNTSKIVKWPNILNKRLKTNKIPNRVIGKMLT